VQRLSEGGSREVGKPPHRILQAAHAPARHRRSPGYDGANGGFARAGWIGALGEVVQRGRAGVKTDSKIVAVSLCICASDKPPPCRSRYFKTLKCLLR
jgi:hypothetical protein